MSPFRPRLLRPVLFAAALVAFAGCDFYDDDDPIIVDNEAVFVDFSLDRDDYFLSEDGLIATFESADIDDGEERDAVEDALLGADLGALVLLYADGSLVFDGGEGTWTALPLTRAYEAVNDGVPYVDYTVTYSYSYDDGDLYFDVLSSAQIDFDDLLPSEMDFRLVTLPADDLARAAALDVTDYEAVARAYALPE